MSERPLVLIEQATRARRSGRLLDAHRGFLEAVTLSRQAGAPHDLIQALKGLGQIERDLGRGEAARPLYEAREKESAVKQRVLPSPSGYRAQA